MMFLIERHCCSVRPLTNSRTCSVETRFSWAGCAIRDLVHSHNSHKMYFPALDPHSNFHLNLHDLSMGVFGSLVCLPTIQGIWSWRNNSHRNVQYGYNVCTKRFFLHESVPLLEPNILNFWSLSTCTEILFLSQNVVNLLERLNWLFSHKTWSHCVKFIIQTKQELMHLVFFSIRLLRCAKIIDTMTTLVGS